MFFFCATLDNIPCTIIGQQQHLPSSRHIITSPFFPPRTWNFSFMYVSLLFSPQFCPCADRERNSCDTPTMWRTSDVREKEDKPRTSTLGMCDLVYPQNDLQVRLDGVTTILGVAPKKNQALVASSTTEATWWSEREKTTVEMRKHCPRVGKNRCR